MNLRHAVFALALCGSVAAGAASVGINYNPRTGDVWIDARLGDINRYGVEDRDYFVDDMVDQFGAPRYLINDLLGSRHWQPGDVYYACALAYQTRRPCKDVVSLYDGSRGQGWGVLAQSMGIKPGSREFFALKDGMGKAHGRFEAHAKAHGKPAGTPGKGDDKANKGNNGKGHDKGDHGDGDHGNGHGKDHG